MNNDIIKSIRDAVNAGDLENACRLLDEDTFNSLNSKDTVIANTDWLVKLCDSKDLNQKIADPQIGLGLANSKILIINHNPIAQSPNSPNGVPLICSVNMCFHLNVNKNSKDVQGALRMKISDSATAVACYEDIKVNMPCMLDAPLATSLVAKLSEISEALSLDEIVNLKELALLFNWAMLYCNVYNVVASNDIPRLVSAYEKSILKPEHRAFIFRF